MLTSTRYVHRAIAALLSLMALAAMGVPVLAQPGPPPAPAILIIDEYRGAHEY